MMTKCDIVCQPSKYGEGVPKVLLEAAAAGRTVVVMDAPGCREVIDDGVEGLLVPAGDSAALAVAQPHLIEGPVARTARGAAGQNRAEGTIGTNEVMDRTHVIYRELLPGEGGN